MNLYKKLLEIRKSVEYLQKTQTGNQGAMYVDPAVLVKRIRDKMDEQAVLLIPNLTGSTVEQISDPTKNNQNATSFIFKSNMVYTFIDCDDGEKLEIPWFITGKHLQDPAMSGGVALTYFERYFLLKTFQIPTSKDDPEYFESKTSEKITEEQIINLTEIIESKGFKSAKAVMAKYAVKIANIPSIEQLPAIKFEDAANFFNEMEAAK